MQFQEGAELSCVRLTSVVSNLIQTVNDRKVSEQKRDHTIGGNLVTLKQRLPLRATVCGPRREMAMVQDAESNYCEIAEGIPDTYLE